MSAFVARKEFVRHSRSSQRLAEIEEKMKKTVETTLGSRQDSLMYLSVAATVKAKQGRGYGSTLVRVITAKVADTYLGVACFNCTYEPHLLLG